MSVDVRPRTKALPLRAEIGRQLRRRRTQGTFIVLTALPLILVLAFWLGDDDTDSGARGFVDLAQDSGANLVVFALFASTGFLFIVIVALFAGDTVPSEASWSSLRYLLAAPVRRGPAAAAEAHRGGAVVDGRADLPAGLDDAGRRSRVRLGSLRRADR